MNVFNPKEIHIADYTYDLPDERIAKFPLEKRDTSKLLVYDNGNITHTVFRELPSLLDDTLLVWNNTKVIYARLLFRKPTGAKIEIFCLNPLEPAEYNEAFGARGEAVWQCIIGNSKKWKQGVLEKQFEIDGHTYTLRASREQNSGENQTVRFVWDQELTFSEVLDAVGLVPIPPYLNREATPKDKNTYQTVYSKIEGSVAAPTAGLHFTPEVIDNLRKKDIEFAEVTLHVGAGTFKPVKSETIGGHEMHTEYFTVELEQLKKIRENLGKITAVGTTSMRTLESLYWLAIKLQNNEDDKFIGQWDAYEMEASLTPQQALDLLIDRTEKNGQERIEAWTQIMIVPGYEFKIVNNLITNFHQPQSTLLLLIAAFVGEDWKRIYNYALENDFRFLSYGDSSLLFGQVQRLHSHSAQGAEKL